MNIAPKKAIFLSWRVWFSDDDFDNGHFPLLEAWEAGVGLVELLLMAISKISLALIKFFTYSIASHFKILAVQVKSIKDGYRIEGCE